MERRAWERGERNGRERWRGGTAVEDGVPAILVEACKDPCKVCCTAVTGLITIIKIKIRAYNSCMNIFQIAAASWVAQRVVTGAVEVAAPLGSRAREQRWRFRRCALSPQRAPSAGLEMLRQLAQGRNSCPAAAKTRARGRACCTECGWCTMDCSRAGAPCRGQRQRGV